MKHLSIKIFFLMWVNFFVINAKQFVPCDSACYEYRTLSDKKKFFKKVCCDYMNHMEIVSMDLIVTPEKTDYFKNNAATIEAASKKYKKDVERRVLAPMYLKFISPEVGYGVFADKDIKKGQFIGIYAGELRAVEWDKPGFVEDVDYAWYYSTDGSNGKKLIIDGKYKGNDLRFINHSNNPNTKIVELVVHGKFYICYVASKDIKKNEQLTVSYGSGYWKSRNVEPEKVT